MKLVIQIPCYNEALELPNTISQLPRQVEGFTTVEWLIVDDGSLDNTSTVASTLGVDHVVRHSRNQGLARAFMTGLDYALQIGADVIVNTDADNQYNSMDIPLITQPILDGRADLVIGERPIWDIEHFSFIKKILQRTGSWVVRTLSKTEIKDAPSGFRAFSRSAAKKIVVFSDYTYTLETIIQAGYKNMAILSVPIRVNGKTRKSRLLRSIPSYLAKSTLTMVRIMVIYYPFKFFGRMGIFLSSLGILAGIRYLYFMVIGDGTGHTQSLILAAILIITGFQTILFAFLCDIVASNRKLLEEIRLKLKE